MKKRTTGELEEKIILDYIKRLEKKDPLKEEKKFGLLCLLLMKKNKNKYLKDLNYTKRLNQRK